jgi:hypothetical protein
MVAKGGLDDESLDPLLSLAAIGGINFTKKCFGFFWFSFSP